MVEALVVIGLVALCLGPIAACYVVMTQKLHSFENALNKFSNDKEIYQTQIDSLSNQIESLDKLVSLPMEQRMKGMEVFDNPYLSKVNL